MAKLQDGTRIFGSANVDNQVVAGNSFNVGTSTLNSTSLAVRSIVANGSIGTASQVLSSNGSAIYWSTTVGYAGSAGTTGFTGSVGFVGSAGTNGFTGSIGFTGSVGFVGSTGVGFAGSAGTNGFTGSIGPIGYTGSPGTGGGGGGGTIIGNAVIDNYTGNGSNTVYTLTTGVTNQNNIIVSVNGLVLTPAVHFTVSNTTLTFTFTPANNDYITVRNQEQGTGVTGFTGSAGAGFTGSSGFTGSAGAVTLSTNNNIFYWNSIINGNVVTGNIQTGAVSGGSATTYSGLANGFILTNTTGQRGAVYWDANTSSWINQEFTIEASFAAANGTAVPADWMQVIVGANTINLPNSSTLSVTGGYGIYVDYYNKRFAVEFNQSNTVFIPFIPLGNSTTSAAAPGGISVYNTTQQFYTLSLKFLNVNNRRRLDIYLNESFQASANLESYTPLGNLLGVAAATGGASATTYFRQLKVTRDGGVIGFTGSAGTGGITTGKTIAMAIVFGG